jgi:hypothetical protein
MFVLIAKFLDIDDGFGLVVDVLEVFKPTAWSN